MREFIVTLHGRSDILGGIITVPYTDTIKLSGSCEAYIEYLVMANFSDVNGFTLVSIDIEEDFKLRWN
jgi:hypothetical protein